MIHNNQKRSENTDPTAHTPPKNIKHINIHIQNAHTHNFVYKYTVGNFVYVRVRARRKFPRAFIMLCVIIVTSRRSQCALSARKIDVNLERLVFGLCLW